MQMLESRLFDLVKMPFGCRETGWIGIDIDHSAITLAQVERTAGRWELFSHQRLPLLIKNDSFEAGAKTSNQKSKSIEKLSETEKSTPGLIESIRQTLRHQPLLFSLFNGRKAACRLPSSLTHLQSLNIPAGSPAEVEMMIQQELEVQNSESETADEFVYWNEDFAPNSDETMSQMSIMTVPSNVVLDIAEGLLNSSVSCQVVSVLPVALAKSLELLHRDDTGVHAAFYWGSASAFFVIVNNGSPVFTRLFRNCGFGNILRLLNERMGLRDHESLQLLNNYQSPTQPVETKMLGQAIGEMIAAPLKLLSREFHKTLEFVKQKRPDLLPSQISILGAGADLSEVEMVLAQLTGVEASLWHLPAAGRTPDYELKRLHSKLGIAMALSAMAFDS